jgi:hypothetical protein
MQMMSSLRFSVVVRLCQPIVHVCQQQQQPLGFVALTNALTNEFTSSVVPCLRSSASLSRRQWEVEWLVVRLSAVIVAVSSR